MTREDACFPALLPSCKSQRIPSIAIFLLSSVISPEVLPWSAGALVVEKSAASLLVLTLGWSLLVVYSLQSELCGPGALAGG